MKTKKQAKQAIHFILTGGTIDSYFEGAIDTVVPYKKSIIPQFIKNLKLYEETEFTQVCMKDSRDLSKTDLENILKAVEESKHKKIIISHGNYTMPNSAKYLKEILKRKDQTIIFTGSLAPLVGVTPSDAAFNLGYSFAKVKELRAGIYICINGKIFTPHEIIKHIHKEKFITHYLPPKLVEKWKNFYPSIE